MDLRKTVPNLPDPSKLVFGHMFTDHMLSINWSAKGGCKFVKSNFLKKTKKNLRNKAFSIFLRGQT